MINVMLVDNQKIFYESLKCLLERNNLINVICYAKDFAGCLDNLRSNKIDIIIMDVVDDCFKIVEFVKNKKLDVKTLILSGNSDVELLVKANELNVDGFIMKDTTDSIELINSIFDVSRGERYIQSELIPILNNYLINLDSDKDKLELLTARELEILKMIAIGGKNSEIAAKMSISERTIKNHLTHIFDKIEVSDRTQAAVFAIKNNLIKI